MDDQQEFRNQKRAPQQRPWMTSAPEIPLFDFELAFDPLSCPNEKAADFVHSAALMLLDYKQWTMRGCFPARSFLGPVIQL